MKPTPPCCAGALIPPCMRIASRWSSIIYPQIVGNKTGNLYTFERTVGGPERLDG
jgi:hypothetical protein